MIIGETIKQTSAVHPQKTAIVCDDEQITYELFHENTKTVQQQLLSILGEAKQKKIAFLLDNNIDFLTLFFAISQIGAIAIPFDPKWSDDDLLKILTDCSPDLFITIQEKEITNVLTLSLSELNKQTTTNVAGLQIAEEDLFYIGYTSGTTGKPKGYLRTHASWAHSFSGSDLVFDITEYDVIFAPGPLVHSHFLYAAVHALHKGATLYITKKFEAKAVYQTLMNDSISILYLVPTMFSALYDVYNETRLPITDLNKVISAGAKWQAPLKEKARHFIPNTNVFEFYGASELSFVSVLDPKGNRENPESVGKPFLGVNVSIRRPDGSEVDTHEIGKLFVQSKQLFSGYLNQPEATKEVFQGDFATVSDLAFRDEQGYITLVGREKNMIISGGLNIYPEEVEKILSTLPEIDEVICIGIPDTHWGEKLVAVIKWRNGNELTSEQLKQYCRQKLASYKCPQLFITFDHLPYTTSRKIARQDVIRQVQEQLEGQRT